MHILITEKATEHQLAAIRELVPGVTITLTQQDEEISRAMPTADVIWGSRYPSELLPQAKQLKLIQVSSAGVDRLLVDTLLAHPTALANARGIHGATISEHVFMLLLAAARDLPTMLAAQGKQEWSRTRVQLLEGKTLGIVGYGSIGQALAARAKAFDMRVIATRRHPQADRHADEVWPESRLADLLQQSDFVILATPLTKETHHLIGASELKMMKPTAVLINIARGPVLDEQALVNCLKEQGIAGAGLDVFETEPLATDSPLWSLPNVIVTPHLAGNMPDYDDRAFAVFSENLRRLVAGEELQNVVDKKLGY